MQGFVDPHGHFLIAQRMHFEALLMIDPAAAEVLSVPLPPQVRGRSQPALFWTGERLLVAGDTRRRPHRQARKNTAPGTRPDGRW